MSSKINSKEKGKRAERSVRDKLRDHGLPARRGQQFSGGTESPDVVCDALPLIHWEVKHVERLNLRNALEQARRDAGSKIPVVAHKKNNQEWLVTLTLDDMLDILVESEYCHDGR